MCNHNEEKKEWNVIQLGMETVLKETEIENIECVAAKVNPWLTALFQSEHLSLLTGNGLTSAIAHLSKVTSADMNAEMNWDNFTEIIEEFVEQTASATGRNCANLEDEFRVAGELWKGLRISDKPQSERLKSCMDENLKKLVTSIYQTEKGIQECKDGTPFSVLCEFLLAFASRPCSRERTNLFTTNYDRLIEAGAEMAGIHLLDRFVGTLKPIFRSSRLDLDIHYNPPGIRGEPRYLEGVVRFAKLHGSLDWFQEARNIVRLGIPFGADFEKFSEAIGETWKLFQMMIYPNDAKDRETAFFPYVELFRDFASAICRPNSVLVTYGYGFGDDHINRIIEDMLTIPSSHLVVISYDDRYGRIKNLCDQKRKQTTLLLGHQAGNLENLVRCFLPNTQQELIHGRMKEILDRRHTVETEPGILVANSAQTEEQK